MKAEELRIGDWYIPYNKPMQWTFSDYGNCECQYEEVGEPIPLTEEWLLKFGFELVDTNADGGHHFWMLQRGGLLLTTPYENDTEVELDNVNTIVKHVHSLQNLYFALTGEELKIK